MGKILDFIPRRPDKFGFERVRKKKKTQAAKAGQLNLFGGGGHVLRLPSNLSPFEEALLLDERGDGRAEECYTRAIEQNDGIADAYCNLGIILSRRGETAKAFDCFTKSLEHNPRHFESHYNLGNLYFEEENFRLARMHYELASGIEPDHPSVYFNLGLVEAIGNNLPAAIQALKKYKSLTPVAEGSKADNLLDTLQRSLAT